MASAKPICGTQALASDSTFDTIIMVFGIAFGIPGAIAGGIAFVGMTEIITIIGIAAPTNVWIAGAAAAAATLAIIIIFAIERCADKKGKNGCAAGVVNETEESFSSGWDTVFPFAAMHDRVDIVVKHDYWPLVENGAGFIKCTDHADPIDESPILQSFFKSDDVCGGGIGSAIGGAAGAVGGIILGALAGAAIGCATIILCLLALLVAAIIAVVAVLVGAFAGGNIGRAAAGNPSPAADGMPVAVGDYITAKGNLIAHGEFDGAICFWWVNDADHHGSSREPGPPFTHRDPDANLQPDGCPRREP